MKRFKYTITDEVGIHARPAGLLVNEAKKYVSKITLSKGRKSSDVTTLMKLVGMGVEKGDEVTIKIEGDDEEEAAKAIKKFMEENF